MYQQGAKQYQKGDYQSAFEYYKKAAALGYADAHFQLALIYLKGHGVEKDEGKFIHHLEEAAIGGQPSARYNLGCHENNNGNIERAVKLWVIAVTQGHDAAIKALIKTFKKGLLEKMSLLLLFVHTRPL